MSRTAVKHVERRCDSPLCIGMALLAAVFGTGVIVYSSAAILLLLR